MVGEIRDFPTAELAVRAALTGHLVLSTLHTNDAPSSVVRLLDMGIAPYLISTSLVAVVAQRLLRRLCTRCKAEYALPASIAQAHGLQEGIPVYAPVGCDECRNTGYKGRIAIVEVMEVNDRVKDLINASAPIPAIRQAAMEGGMHLLVQSALRNVILGVTSVEEMLALSIHSD
jgi:type IV pilus assembly protein PilB